MSDTKKVLLLLGTISAIIFLPYFGARIRFQGNFPPDFFDFPALVAPEKSPFNLLIFIGIALFCVAVIVFYCFPHLFGFKKMPPVPPAPRRAKVPLPIWFWVGLLMWAPTLFVLCGHFQEPRWLINWACLPLFWGFTLLLDGCVYVRTGGRSLVATAPRELLAMGVASISGWMIFEWLNFFVYENWVYPKGDLIPDDEFIVYANIGSSGLMPMVFEWYSLFYSFESFREKYRQGPKVIIPRRVKVVITSALLIGMFAISAYPETLYGLLWIAPLVILAIVLNLADIHTPFTYLKVGNWSPLLLMSLTYVVQGFLCECWNYLSGTHIGGQLETVNPDYWTYSIPYVNVCHVFEMPILGYAGYIPFGVYCAVWWVFFSWLLDIKTGFLKLHE